MVFNNLKAITICRKRYWTTRFGYNNFTSAYIIVFQLFRLRRSNEPINLFRECVLET